MRRLVLVSCVAACQPAAPAAPKPAATGGACAAALPLLAKQHTPNITAVYLAPLSLEAGAVTIGTPVLATAKRGFVNQPAFTADGTGLYFTWRPEGSQADIWFRDLQTGAEHPVTCSSEEEYAAHLAGDGLTVVRVERDLRRDLVRLGLDGKLRRSLFPALTNVGAQLWVDDDTAVVYVMGEPAASLVRADLRTGTLETIAHDLGPAMAVIPGTRNLSVVDQTAEGPAKLVRLDIDTRATTPLLTLPDGVDQVAWLPDGSVVAGVGKRLVRASIAAPEWHDIAELAIAGSISRVVVSADRRRIALVVRVDAK